MENTVILLTRSLLEKDLRYIQDGLERLVPGCCRIVAPETFDEAGILARAPEADVLLGPYVTPGILGAAKRLRLIQVPWTGMDTVDFSALRDCAVPVCNTHSNADAVAELGVALLLDLVKKVSYHDRKMRAGDWNRGQRPLSLTSAMVAGQTVCILGCGSIGLRLAKLLHAFGARVIAVGSREDEALAALYPRERLAEAAAGADVVVSALPLTEETRGLVDARLIGQMKRGVVLLNLSRAGVMDEAAVYQGLTDGQIGAFGSDVWWNAPKRGESESWPSARFPFWELDNVVLSPHRAGFVQGALPHLDGAIENIANLILGKPLSGVVDLKKGY